MSIQWGDTDRNVPTFDVPGWLRHVLRFDRGSRVGGRVVAVPVIPVGRHAVPEGAANTHK